MITLTHPFESPSGNDFHKRHWIGYAKHKKNCVRWAQIVCHGTARASCKRSVAFIAYRKRTLDDDNLITGMKALRDALVFVGVIHDDSPKWATFTYEQKPASESPNGMPCTVITITEEP